MSAATIHNKRLLLKQNSGVQSLKIALMAVEVALKSVDPFLLIKNSMKLTGSELCINDVDCRSKKFDLSLFDRIYIVGAGKATAGMSEAVIHVLGGRVSGGAITIPYDISTRRSILSITHAGHPLPDRNGLEGTKKILSILDNAYAGPSAYGTARSSPRPPRSASRS